MGEDAVVSIETHSGLWIDLLDPKPEMICIEDIAFSLADTSRFGGHARHSVADHSETVRLLCDLNRAGRHAQLVALLHDAHEAYLLDVPRPIKQMPVMGWYRAACARMQEVIHVALGVAPPGQDDVDLVKQMDWVAMLFEAEEHMPGEGRPWRDDEPWLLLRAMDLRHEAKVGVRRPWYHKWSEDMFLERYRELKA